MGYGFNRCQVRIDDNGDAFSADDASVFSVRRSDPERVLFVHAAGDTRSALYFGAALDAAAHGSFVLQSVAEEQATDLDPSRFSFVVLSDSMALPTIFEHSLQAYVAKGGNVFIALGILAAHQHRIPLWGSNTLDPRNYARNGGSATIGQLDFSFPALAQAQPGADNGGWSEAKIFYDVPVDAGQARVPGRLSDGTPLLLEKQMGEGRVLLLTTGLDNLTNDLPLHPIFVAFVDHTAHYLSGSEQLSGARLVDSYLQLRAAAHPFAASGNVEVIDPDGHRPLSLSESRTAQSLRLERAGFYQIHFANGRDAVIGVNPDRRESNLEPMSPDLLALWSGSSAGAGPPQSTTVATDQSSYRVQTLWWWVMLLALLVAVSETALASRYLGTLREEP